MQTSARAAIASILILCAFSAAAQDWRSTLGPSARGAFPAPRPFHATYGFGWSGFTAARAEVRERKPSPDRLELDGAVHTIDLARALWRYDVDHSAISDLATLHPVEVKQTELVQSKKVDTHLAFDATGVTAIRNTGKNPPKPLRIEESNLFDLHSSLLFLRSQSLQDGEVARILVFPGKDIYLATITVAGRGKISVPAGNFSAIRLDLQLSKVGKTGALEPHKKFRRATVWISDDTDRTLLRIEAQIFVGTIFAELQTIQFDTPKS